MTKNEHFERWFEQSSIELDHKQFAERCFMAGLELGMDAIMDSHLARELFDVE